MTQQPLPPGAPSLTFVGTATTLIRLGRFTVLTDPNVLHKGRRACLGRGLWSRRLTEPALGVADLPRLDAVVLSHLHGDRLRWRRSPGVGRGTEGRTRRPRSGVNHRECRSGAWVRAGQHQRSPGPVGGHVPRDRRRLRRRRCRSKRSHRRCEEGR